MTNRVKVPTEDGNDLEIEFPLSSGRAFNVYVNGRRVKYLPRCYIPVVAKVVGERIAISKKESQ